MKKIALVITGLFLAIFSANAIQQGQLAAWGDNSYGKTNFPAGLTNCVAVAAGQFHALALDSNGNVTAWGSNKCSVWLEQCCCNCCWLESQLGSKKQWTHGCLG